MGTICFAGVTLGTMCVAGVTFHYYRSSSEDEEENEEPELNLRPQKPLLSPVKTAMPRETGFVMTPNRVPLGDVDNKDKSLVI